MSNPLDHFINFVSHRPKTSIGICMGVLFTVGMVDGAMIGIYNIKESLARNAKDEKLAKCYQGKTDSIVYFAAVTSYFFWSLATALGSSAIFENQKPAAVICGLSMIGLLLTQAYAIKKVTSIEMPQ